MNEITLDSLHPTLKEFNPNFVLIGDLKNIDKDIDKNGDSQASVNDVVLNWDSFNVAADETVSFDANPSYKNLIVSFGDNPASNSELVGFKLTNIAGKDVINENSANEQVADFTISVTSNTAKDAVDAGITDKVILGPVAIQKELDPVENLLDDNALITYNAQNGSSMLKVAEGAVSSTVEILRTLKEKAINAVNDNNTEIDRAAIQKELNASVQQIDDNALLTFNGKFLDYGVPTYQEYPEDIVLQVGANANQPMELDTVIFL